MNKQELIKKNSKRRTFKLIEIQDKLKNNEKVKVKDFMDL